MKGPARFYFCVYSGTFSVLSFGDLGNLVQFMLKRVSGLVTSKELLWQEWQQFY